MEGVFQGSELCSHKPVDVTTHVQVNSGQSWEQSWCAYQGLVSWSQPSHVSCVSAHSWWLCLLVSDAEDLCFPLSGLLGRA